MVSKFWKGRWWNVGDANPQLAVSEEDVRDFQIHLGDKVKFQVAGRLLEAQVVAVFRREGAHPCDTILSFRRPHSRISRCLLRRRSC
jgi:hypothetical protein